MPWGFTGLLLETHPIQVLHTYVPAAADIMFTLEEVIKLFISSSLDSMQSLEAENQTPLPKDCVKLLLVGKATVAIGTKYVFMFVL